ncbi:MAG: polysaccharide pyruvyl transferase family protein [Deltaproteobacteria bacterium]|nr:polysaccharide pyruvyl transferase family protein [Deltaproteobacteria bacterium]
MKGDRPRITLLGSNSGRNVGDAAILSAILDVFSKELPKAEFFVPSTHPKFTDENYGSKYAVKGVDVMPWTGSIRLLGIPTIRCLWKSDLAFICDGIIFGKKILNPLFNFLITLVFIVPIARLLRCKVVCYSCGIGPFPSKLSRIMARWVLNQCDLVIMRENDSKKLAEEIGCSQPIQVTGDAAFLNPVSSRDRGREILKSNGIDPNAALLGINVTRYIDSWLDSHERVQDRSTFLKALAEGVKAAQSNCGFVPVVFSTQPMDEPTAQQLASLLETKVIDNTRYLSHDMQAVMRECQLFMGMRFHSVVLASAVETPIIGLIYAPKVRGFMRLLSCENLALELAKLTPASLTAVLNEAWAQRTEIKHKQKIHIDELKDGALRAARMVSARYFEHPSRIEEAAKIAAAS